MIGASGYEVPPESVRAHATQGASLFFKARIDLQAAPAAKAPEPEEDEDMGFSLFD